MSYDEDDYPDKMYFVGVITAEEIGEGVHSNVITCIGDNIRVVKSSLVEPERNRYVYQTVDGDRLREDEIYIQAPMGDIAEVVNPKIVKTHVEPPEYIYVVAVGFAVERGEKFYYEYRIITDDEETARSEYNDVNWRTQREEAIRDHAMLLKISFNQVYSSAMGILLGENVLELKMSRTPRVASVESRG